MSNEERKKSFMEYKSNFIRYIVDLESKRLSDLQNARDDLYKYALPSSLIDGALGGLSTYLTGNFILIVPTMLFLILIYLLALTIDFSKLIERLDLIALTDKYLTNIKDEVTTFRNS